MRLKTILVERTRRPLYSVLPPFPVGIFPTDLLFGKFISLFGGLSFCNVLGSYPFLSVYGGSLFLQDRVNLQCQDKAFNNKCLLVVTAQDKVMIMYFTQVRNDMHVINDPYSETDDLFVFAFSLLYVVSGTLGKILTLSCLSTNPLCLPCGDSNFGDSENPSLAFMITGVEPSPVSTWASKQGGGHAKLLQKKDSNVDFHYAHVDTGEGSTPVIINANDGFSESPKFESPHGRQRGCISFCRWLKLICNILSRIQSFILSRCISFCHWLKLVGIVLS
jgi:hypothetical protein